MDMKIYIPTYRRIDRQVTLKHLPKEFRQNTYLVAPSDEATSLRWRYKDQCAGVIEQPAEITTIAAKRAWIIQNCDSPKLMMLDDDIKFNIRINETDFNLRQQEMEDRRLWELLHELRERLDVYAHVGISPRQGNNHLEYGWHDVGRMIYAMAFQTSVANTMELGRINTREDMDYTLQLLRRGLPNSICAKFACSPLGFNAAGGASTERTVESSNLDAEKLAALHPGFVRITEKAYKVSLPRKEVVVSWQKAFKSSQQKE